MAETIAYLTEPRHSRHGPCRPDAAGGAHASAAIARAARDRERRDDDIVEDAEAIAAAGAFSLVIEGTGRSRWRSAITQRVAIPTIGIGASPACDGRVLVIDDVIGMFGDFTPQLRAPLCRDRRPRSPGRQRAMPPTSAPAAFPVRRTASASAPLCSPAPKVTSPSFSDCR